MVFTILRTRPRKNCFFQSINQAVVCSAMLPVSRAGYDAHEAPTLLLTRLWRPPHGRHCPPASCRARPAGGAAQSGPGPPQRGGGNTALARRSFAKVPAQFLPLRCPAGHHRLARQPAAPPAASWRCRRPRAEVSAGGGGMAAPGPSRRLLLRQPARRWLHGPGPARGGSSLPHAPLRAPPRGPRGAAAAPRLRGRGA